jgi:asparagine synthase (glutamine-hydrolysing)
VPFLDYQLVELAFSLNATELLDGVTTKKIVRRALADVLPPTVAARTDKLGFATPEAVWFRGALGEFASDVFSSAAFRSRGFVDADAALTRLQAHRAGTLDAGFELWRALNTELWARSFLQATD